MLFSLRHSNYCYSPLSHILGARRRRGSSIVEFALIVPILLALLMAILEFALLSRNQLMISNAVREGTRAASLGASTTTVKTRIKNATSMLGVTDAQITLTYSNDDGATYPYTVTDSGTKNTAPSGSLLRVMVNYPHKPLTNFFPILKNRNINVAVSMRRESS